MQSKLEIFLILFLDLYGQNHLVNFEKILACLTHPGYDLQNNPKDFSPNRDFVLICKDQLSAQKSVQMSSEWSQLFAAWEADIFTLYSHQAAELAAYSTQVSGFF